MADSVSGEGLLPGLHMTVFSLYPHRAEREVIPPHVSSYKGPAPICEAPPSRPNYLPNALSLNTITLGVRVSVHGFGGHKHAVHK